MAVTVIPNMIKCSFLNFVKCKNSFILNVFSVFCIFFRFMLVVLTIFYNLEKCLCQEKTSLAVWRMCGSTTWTLLGTQE